MPTHDPTLVDSLVRLWRGGNVDIDEAAEPADVADGLGVQVEVLDRLLAEGEVQAGYKAAFSSGAGRAAFPDGFRPFGYVLRSGVHRGGAALPLASIPGCVIEPEIGVVLGASLSGPDVSVEEAREAVSALVPSIEVNAVRLPGRSIPLVAAGNLGGWGIVVGDEVPVGVIDPADVIATLREGDEVRAVAAARDEVDDPFLTLTRVCASLDRFGRGLEAGQRVVTGAFAVQPVTRPGTWTASLTGLGEVSITFT